MRRTESLKLEVPGTFWESGGLRMEDWNFEMKERKSNRDKKQIQVSLQGENTGNDAIFSFEQVRQLHGWLTKYLERN
jgi:hypothetical protein